MHHFFYFFLLPVTYCNSYIHNCNLSLKFRNSLILSISSTFCLFWYEVFTFTYFLAHISLSWYQFYCRNQNLLSVWLPAAIFLEFFRKLGLEVLQRDITLFYVNLKFYLWVTVFPFDLIFMRQFFLIFQGTNSEQGHLAEVLELPLLLVGPTCGILWCTSWLLMTAHFILMGPGEK